MIFPDEQQLKSPEAIERDKPKKRRFPPDFLTGLATLGPVGFVGRAPGTTGSAVGGALFLFLLYPLPLWVQLALVPVLFMLSVWLCGVAEKRLDEVDPGEVILDEVAAMPICFLGVTGYIEPTGGVVLVIVGFALFRVFDILKPFGLKQLQRLPGGWGVVADDFVAAGIVCALFHAVFQLYGLSVAG